MAEIDTSIYQQQRQPDLMDSMSKMIQMKSLLQNQATQAQAQEMGGLQLEEKKQQMQDQDLLRTGYRLVGGDLGKLAQWGAQNGVRVGTIQGLQAADLKMKAEITKIKADQIPIEKERNGRIVGVIEAAQNMTDEQRQAAWPMIVSAMGAIHPRSPLSADHVLSSDDLELLKLGVQNHDDQMKARESGQKTKTWQDEQAALPDKIAGQKAKLAKDQLEVVQAQLQGAAQTAPRTNQADWDAWLGTLSPETRSRMPAMFSDQAYKVVQRMGMKPSEAAAAETAAKNAEYNVSLNELALRSAKGDPDAKKAMQELIRVHQAQSPTWQIMNGASGPPGPAAIAAATGNLDPATYRTRMRRDPTFLDQVLKVNPDFNESDIEMTFQTGKEFGSTSAGKAGGQLLALNTLIHHADLYLDIAKSVKAGTFKPGNAAYNAISTMMGRPAPNNLALISQFLAGEGGKVATGGIPAQAEIHSIMERLAGANSADQLEEAGKLLIQIGGGRMGPLRERLKQARLTKVYQVLDPESEAILRARGFDPETMKPVAAGGGTGGGLPTVGGEFNGGKVLSIKRVN